MDDLLATATCGTASIDLSLPTPLRPGTTTYATVELVGGTRAERVDGLDLVFESSSGAEEERWDDETPGGRKSVGVADTVRIAPGEHRVLETEIAIPLSIPVSLGGTQVRVGLGSSEVAAAGSSGRRPPAGSGAAEVPLAPDGGITTSRWTTATLSAGPSRPVQIRPGERLAQVLDAVSALGFFLESATPMPGHISGRQREAGPAPIQEFQFRPRWGPFESEGDLFLYPIPSEDRLDVGVLLVDQEGVPAGVEAAPERPLDGTDRLTVRDTDPQSVRSDLRELLDRRVDGNNR